MKPEKFKYIVSTPNKKEDRFKFHEDCGYNRAIDDYETWLKQSVSVEKIESILKDWGVSIVESYKMGVDEYREWRKSLAESISKSIIGK